MPTTRQRVLALVKQSPHLNQTEIAERLDVSRQRVSQIVESESLGVPKGKRGARGKKRVITAEAAPAYAAGALPAYLANAGGSVGVLIAAADLMTRGYSVYLPVAGTLAAADIVAIDARGKVKRFSVHTAKRPSSGDYEYPKPSEVDERVMILTDAPVSYSPSF